MPESEVKQRKPGTIRQGFRAQSGSSPPNKRQLTGVLKRWLKRRSAIEPVISHSKQDHAMERNYLPGKIGARINAFLVGCRFNLRKLFHFFLSNPLIQVPANT